MKPLTIFLFSFIAPLVLSITYPLPKYSYNLTNYGNTLYILNMAVGQGQTDLNFQFAIDTAADVSNIVIQFHEVYICWTKEHMHHMLRHKEIRREIELIIFCYRSKHLNCHCKYTEIIIIVKFGPSPKDSVQRIQGILFRDSL